MAGSGCSWRLRFFRYAAAFGGFLLTATACGGNELELWRLCVDETGVSIREFADHRAIASAAVGEHPQGVAVADDVVWVTNRGDGTVTRIAPAAVAFTVEDTVSVGLDPMEVAAGEGAA